MFEERLDNHVTLVTTVSDAGAPPPPQWTALLDSLNQFINMSAEQTYRDKLISAIITCADRETIQELRVHAIAESQGPFAFHAVAQDEVLTQLCKLYAETGAANYAAIAKLYDDAAKQFVTAASVVDVESDAAVMVTEADKPRKAWLDAESFGNALTRLVEPLAAAAQLAGVRGADNDTIRLPLCCDLADVHRRRAWQAWLTRTGRCGRWPVLLKAGATLRAASLDSLTPYREPRPIEHRQESIANGRVRNIEIDPEDADYRPPPIDPRRKQQGRTMAV